MGVTNRWINVCMEMQKDNKDHGRWDDLCGCAVLLPDLCTFKVIQRRYVEVMYAQWSDVNKRELLN